jgi:hypothetical protein
MKAFFEDLLTTSPTLSANASRRKWLKDIGHVRPVGNETPQKKAPLICYI